jgi:WD40 repeat protein
MKIFHEKKASHCLQWMKHDKKIIVGTSKGNLCTFNIHEFLDEGRAGQILRNVKNNIHNCAIQCLKYNHTGNFLLSGDKSGLIKYFKTSLDTENKPHLAKEVNIFFLKKLGR